MPRKKPTAENAKERTSVSLKKKTFDTARAILEQDGDLENEISKLVEVALIAYAEAHYPGLHDEIVARLKSESPSPVTLKQQPRQVPKRKNPAA